MGHILARGFKFRFGLAMLVFEVPGIQALTTCATRLKKKKLTAYLPWRLCP
jgi:hypothetical protein